MVAGFACVDIAQKRSLLNSSAASRAEEKCFEVWGKGLVAVAAGAEGHLERGHIGLVAADAQGVHRQAQHFGLFEAKSCIIKLSQAVALGGNQAIAGGAVHRARRIRHCSAPAYPVEKVVPIPSDPHGPSPRFSPS